MDCNLEDYRATVDTWAGRFSWRDVLRRGDTNGIIDDCLGVTVIISMILAIFLKIDGIHQNPGPVENFVRLMNCLRQESEEGNPI